MLWCCVTLCSCSAFRPGTELGVAHRSIESWCHVVAERMKSEMVYANILLLFDSDLVFLVRSPLRLKLGRTKPG